MAARPRRKRHRDGQTRGAGRGCLELVQEKQSRSVRTPRRRAVPGREVILWPASERSNHARDALPRRYSGVIAEPGANVRTQRPNRPRRIQGPPARRATRSPPVRFFFTTNDSAPRADRSDHGIGAGPACGHGSRANCTPRSRRFVERSRRPPRRGEQPVASLTPPSARGAASPRARLQEPHTSSRQPRRPYGP